MDHLNQEVPELAREAIRALSGIAALLGQRTGDLHAALASDRRDPDFAPGAFYLVLSVVRALPKFMRIETPHRDGLLLRDRLSTLPEETRAGAERLIYSLQEQDISNITRLGRSTEK